MTYRYALLASLSLVSFGTGCGSIVIGGNTGGAGGGETGTTITTGTTGTTVTSTTTATGTWTTTTTDTGTWTTTTTGMGGSPPSAYPPGPGPMNPPDGMGSSVFAVRRLLLGDTNPDGTPNAASGWKQYGYDLDGQVSTANSVGLCKPQLNAAPKNVYPDGYGGIDNSFGKNILPILLGLSSDFSTQVNDAIASGKRTILLDLENLGAGAGYNPLLSRFYDGAPLGSPPKWNGLDAWPVAYESLAAPPSLASAKVQAPQTYVVNNTWVAPLQGDIVLTFDASGFGLKVPIHNPIITMELDASHQNGTHGIIAGVVPTDAFVASIKQVAGTFDPTLCNGPTIDSIVAQIAQASDILLDGTQDPSKQCNGISIGLGFEAHAVKFGAIAPPAPPQPNPCAP
jgi:hypothetical protein